MCGGTMRSSLLCRGFSFAAVQKNREEAIAVRDISTAGKLCFESQRCIRRRWMVTYLEFSVLITLKALWFGIRRISYLTRGGWCFFYNVIVIRRDLPHSITRIPTHHQCAERFFLRLSTLPKEYTFPEWLGKVSAVPGQAPVLFLTHMASCYFFLWMKTILVLARIYRGLFENSTIIFHGNLCRHVMIYCWWQQPS